MDLADVDRLFQQLNSNVVHSYEEALKQEQQRRERWTQQRQRRHEQVREIMGASQLNLERLDRLEQEDEAALGDFLRMERPPLAERSSHLRESAKKRALYTGLQVPNRSLSTVYAATLLAKDHTNLTGNPGEQGNPWVLPWNPGRVKVKAAETGLNNWGCPDLGPSQGPGHTQAVFWFVFTPDRTAMWNLLALIDLYGFYILRANDEWWNCKDSWVSVEAIMDVYQYYWNGQKHFPLLHIDAGNINVAQLYDDAGQFDYQVGLRAGDLAFVRVITSIGVYAQGGGSYSEVNFSTHCLTGESYFGERGCLMNNLTLARFV